MKIIRKDTIRFLAVIGILITLWIGGCAYVVNEVEQVGLKNILGELWEGKE